MPHHRSPGRQKVCYCRKEKHKNLSTSYATKRKLAKMKKIKDSAKKCSLSLSGACNYLQNKQKL